MLWDFNSEVCYCDVNGIFSMLWDFNSDVNKIFMGFSLILWDFNGMLWDFNSDGNGILMGFSLILWDFNGMLWDFDSDVKCDVNGMFPDFMGF